MTWISINEAHPALHKPVLICAHDGTVCSAKLTQIDESRSLTYWNPVGGGAYEFEWNWNDLLPWGGVTHWMELPAPPQTSASAAQTSADPIAP